MATEKVVLKSGRALSAAIFEGGRREFATGTVCTAEEDKTRQQDLEASDINKIVERMGGSVVFPALTAEQVDALYIDVSELGSYRDAMHEVDRVRSEFDKLSATARKAFDNDPAVFLDAIDRQDVDALVEAGVLKRQVEAAPAPPVAPVAVPSVEKPVTPKA